MLTWLLRRTADALQSRKMRDHKRRVSFGDLVTDRWENAKCYGFGEGSSMYDSALVVGDVKVGRNTWIGPNVILDGSGGLSIGGHCTICAGSQIYSHDTVQWAVNGSDYERGETKIGNNCFIGPNAVIARGVHIGDRCIIGALSFVNTDIPSGATAFGNPAKITKRQNSEWFEWANGTTPER